MKKSFIAMVLVVLLLAAPAAWAKSTLTVDPLGLLMKRVTVKFETGVASWPTPLTLGMLGSFRDGGTDVGAGVRYYVDGVAHEGLYFGGYGMLTSLRSTAGGAASGTFGVSGVAGYKWQLDNGIVLDAGAAIGIPAPVYSGIHFGVGLAF